MKRFLIFLLIITIIFPVLNFEVIAVGTVGEVILNEPFTYASYPTLLNSTIADGNWSTGWKANNTLTTELDSTYSVATAGEVSRDNALTVYRGTPSITLNGEFDYFFKWDQSISSNINTTTTAATGFAAQLIYGTNNITRIGVIALAVPNTLKQFKPYFMLQGGTNQNGNSNVVLNADTDYTIVARLNSRGTSTKTVTGSMMAYESGMVQPGDWHTINTSTGMTNWVYSAFGLSGATYHPSGPLKVKALKIEKYTRAEIEPIDNAVNTLAGTPTRTNLEFAEQKIETLIDGIAKDTFGAKIREIKYSIIEQEQLVMQAEAELSSVEGIQITDENYFDIQQDINSVLAVISGITDVNVKHSFMNRLNVIQFELDRVAITGSRAREYFNYPDGYMLSSTKSDSYWNTGWKANSELNESVSDDVTIYNEELSLNTAKSVYRQFKQAIIIEPNKEYYIKFSMKLKATMQQNEWAGILIDDVMIGIMGNKAFGKNGADNSVVSGETIHNNWYDFMIKIDKSGKAAYKSWKSSEGESHEWFGIGTISGSHDVIGLLSSASGTVFDGIVKEQYPEGYTNDLLDTISDINKTLINNRATLNLKQQELDSIKTRAVDLVDCLAKDDVLSQIANAQNLLDSGEELINQDDALVAVENAEFDKTVNSLNIAKDKVSIILTEAVKSELNLRLIVVEEYINNITPIVTLVAIEEEKSGLKGSYTISDTIGNSADPQFRWYSGGKVIDNSKILSNVSDYSGQKILFEVTPMNTAGKKGVPVRSREYNVPTIKSSTKISGGGGAYPVVIPTATPIPTITQQPKGKSFVDIAGHWAENQIAVLVEKDLVKGKGESIFDPDSFVTRAEFVALITRALSIEDVEAKENVFNDVKINDWYYSTIYSAYQSGLISGSGDSFRPNDKITREEAVVVLIKALKKLGKEVKKSDMIFGDSDKISPWAVDYVNQAVATGLVKGMGDGYFSPNSDATRAQAVIMITRLLGVK